MTRMSPACFLHVTGDCVAVHEGERDGEAILTLVRAIEVHNLYDHRCVHSWSLSSTDHVTCSAHFHRVLGKYCAVRNGSELLLWTSEDKTLSSHISLPFSPLSLLTSSIAHCLITVGVGGAVAMVSVEGGNVRMVSEVVIGGRHTRHKHLRVVESVMCEVGGRESVMVICGSGEVWLCAVDESGLTATRTLQLSVKIVDNTMLALCGDFLLVGESDGIIESHDLSHPSHPPCPLPSSRSHSLIKGLSSNHFAVVEPGCVVSLRDNLYGTCQASMETGFNNITKLWCVYDHVVMCGSEGVMVCRVSGMDRVSLATGLGKTSVPPREALLVTPTWVGPTQVPSDWRSEVIASSLDEVSSIQQMCDPRKTPTLEAVMAVFPTSLMLHSLAYCMVVRRLVEEREFWAHAALMELVKCGAVAGNLTGDVVTRALEERDWSMIVLVLSCSQGLPETALVNVLRHSLELPEVVESYGVVLTRCGIMWAVLAVPYNDTLLQMPLSQMPLSCVLSFLQFLSPHISVASLSSQPPVPYPHLLDWLAAILDSHWTALVLSPLARQVLKNFKHTTYHQMLFCENISTVQNLLEATRKPRPHLPEDKWKYYIERLDLKI